MSARAEVRTSPEAKARWQAAAEKSGLSLNAFLIKAANEASQDVEAREKRREFEWKTRQAQRRYERRGANVEA